MSYKRALQLYLHACTGSVHIYHIDLISNSSSTFFKSMCMKVIPASLVDIFWDGAPALFQCRSSSSPGQRLICVYRRLNKHSNRLLSVHIRMHYTTTSGKTGPGSGLFFSNLKIKNHQISKCRRQSFGSFVLFLLIFSTSFV